MVSGGKCVWAVTVSTDGHTAHSAEGDQLGDLSTLADPSVVENSE